MKGHLQESTEMSNSLARKQDWKKVALTNVLAYDYAVFITIARSFKVQ
jgi:hypothetical protein